MKTEIQGNRFIRFGNNEEHFVVPDYVCSLAELSFADCDRLISLVIPEGVEEIGNYAFANCYALREIRLPAKVGKAGAGLFQKCWNVRDIVLPEGIVTLGTDMFEGCHALHSLDLPDSLESVARTAFSSCRSLRKVYIRPEHLGLLPVSARYLAAMTYMEEHRPEDGNELIDRYVADRSRSILDLAINRRSSEAVRYMLERGLVTEESLPEFLVKSVKTGRVEITALLLEHGRNKKDDMLDPDPFL